MSDMSDNQARRYAFSDFHLHPGEHLLLRNGHPVALAPKAFETLVLLVAHAGHVLRKEDLLHELWPETFVEENNLNRNISTLRKALGDSPHNPKYIATVPKIGFRFVADVARLRQENPESASERDLQDVQRQGDGPNTDQDQQTHANEPAVVGLSDTGPPRNSKWFRQVWVLLLMFSVVTLSMYFAAGPNSEGEIDSIAVLPFLNEESATEYLTEGITESLIHTLSQLPKTKVISWTSVSQYKGNMADPVKVGEDLNVGAVLTGRIAQREDLIFIYMELVDVEDRSRLWGEQFSRKLVDVAALPDEISRVTAEKLRLQLTADEKQRLFAHYTPSSHAYQIYLKGLYSRNKKTEAGMEKAVEYFKEAINEDPRYAHAYAELARSYNWMARTGRWAPREVSPIAAAMAGNALALDDTLGAAHTALADARFSTWDLSGAETEYKQGIERSPNDPDAHGMYSLYLMTLGRFSEALREARLAADLDPLSLNWDARIGLILFMARQYDQAIQHFRELLEVEGNLLMARQYLGEAYSAKGMYREALEEYRQAADFLGVDLDAVFAEGEEVMPISGASIGLLARTTHLLAISGNRDKAENMLDRINKSAKQTYTNPMIMAKAYIGLGDYDQAFELLERAFETRVPAMIGLSIFPGYDALRLDPRFEDLERRIRLARN